MTTFEPMAAADLYYMRDDNYKDDVPFDLYNMVSLAKRIDFKKKYDLGFMKNITQEIQRMEKNVTIESNDIYEVAEKHLEPDYDQMDDLQSQ